MPHFVNLERTFRPFAEAIGQDSEFAKAWYGLVEDGQTWDELLEKKRVVILAEAGAGKTHEMRTTAKKLIGDGKAAFFIDITDLSNAPINEILLRDDKTRFEAWMKSNDDGWFLLDSVDEARLASFRNFKNALRGLARSIERHLGRAHIFISCRVSDWHAHSDRALVADMLPIPLKSSTDGGVINQDLPLTSQKDDKRPEDDVYLAELQELSKTQMQRYALAQDGINAKAFMRALEEADAYRFAERPLDLDEIIGYWREHNRIGSHAEMIEFNIEKKLIEHKAERRREQPLSADNALQGVTVLAAGLTFTKLNSIRLPDDTPAPELGDKAIRAEDILTDWNSNEIQSLLTRPIFDNATYGRVRFHHRSVREYLTAKWLKNLLQKGRSRRPVKSLFFTKRYGLDIVVPSMQPIVAWLAIENEQIRNQTLAIAPEILINYGDPSQFPVDFRERMLRNIVTLHNTPESRLSFDVSAVRRFASSDLASVLIELLESQPVNLDLRHLLLRVIWQGGLSDCAGIALSYALDSSMDPSTKHYAILAVSATGDTEQKTKLIKAIMANLKAWRKDAVGIFVEEFFPEMLSVDDLFKILKTFPDHDEFDSSRLSYYLEKLPILRLLTDDYLKILDWIFHQVNAPRLKEPNYSVTANEIHLMRAAMKIIAHLMGKAFLDDEGGYPESVLELFEYAATITYHGRNVSDGVIPEFVQSHKGLRHELFWRGVQRSRANLQKKGKHFRNYLQMPFEYKICKLPYDDFPYFLQEINNKEFADDRHVAFSAAYAIWWRTSSDKKDLERLQDAVSEHPKLVNLLAKKIGENGPPSPEPLALKYGIEAEEAKKKKEKKKWAQWKEKLQGDPERLKNVTAGNMAELAGDFVSLISRLDNHEERRMTLGVYSDWRNLVPIFGLEVAKAFKDGLNRYWRLYSPVLDSESNNSQYPWELSVGLTGLAFESSESPDWTQRLTSDEANLASRYAACEMSEFPAWTKDVAWNRPQEFASVMQKEIAWEFNKPNKENIFPRNLSKLAYSRDEIAMACHSSLLRLLEERDPENNKALDRALISLLGKGATDIIRLGNLARLRFTTAKSDARKLAWLLVWFCVGADGAATALEQWLDTTKEKDEGDKLIISLATALFGNSHGVCFKSNYQDFLRAEPLSRLVEILYRHIREEEDPHRSGHYTPTARDNAERVRNKLVETLATNPSRENYATLASLASRLNSNWIAYLAKACAERAADFEAWKASDVAEFAKIGTSIPRDDRALFDLALLRLDDLKLDLEYGDTSIADMLVDDPETVLRNWFIRELRKSSRSHYAVVPEEEMADGKRPDIRFHAPAVNGPVPVELKIADHWTLAQLKERVQNQLIGQYLRDDATLYGVFLLVYKGTKTSWVDRSAKQRASSLNELCAVLQQEADSPIKKDAIFEEVRVIGIDLTKRGRPAS